MDHLRQLSARYNAVWMETSQLYETWARRRGLSFYELLVVLSITETEEAVFQKDICRRFTIPKQTVHAIIKTLADKGVAGTGSFGTGPKEPETLFDG